jgi:pyruvate dehydrogenase kinase 2/3/4
MRAGGSRRSISTALDQFDESHRAEVASFSAMQPRPINLGEILATLKPWSVAKFIQLEYPIRIAQRIKMVESISGWDTVPELVEVHAVHMWAFKSMREVERKPSLDPFTTLVKEINKRNSNHVNIMTFALQKLLENHPDEFNADFVDRFLGNFFSNRISTNMLLKQYAALSGQFGEGSMKTGLVDPHCDVAAICRSAAQATQWICKKETHQQPLIHVMVRSVAGGDMGVPKVPYMPGVLQYIMMEILKNSSRATLEAVGSEAELTERPISVIVCADEHRLQICVADKAGGIPFDVGQHMWSYLYTTSEKKGTALAGYGVGLPLSRLFAQYLSGSLNLVTLPGWGTHAYLYLPRTRSEQVEVIATDVDFAHDPYANFFL